MNTLEKIMNSMGVRSVDKAENIRAGQVAVWNVAEGVVPTQFLTDYATGLLTRNNMAETLAHIAPVAPVIATPGNVAFQYAYYPLAEEFPQVGYEKLVRAQGGDFPFTDSTAQRRDGHVDQIGISIAIEQSLVNALGDAYKQRALRRLVEIINRASLIKALGMLDDIAEESTIDLTSDTNPDGTLRTALHKAAERAGIRPNRLLYGTGAWDMRTAKYEALAPMSSAAFRAARDADELGRSLGVSVVVPDGRAASADGTFPTIATNKIYAVVGFDGVSTDDPSTMKTFRPPEGISVYESVHPQGEKIILTAKVWQSIMVTQPEGALAIEVKNS